MNTDYDRIARAICFITAHTQQQPSLESIAAHVHLSPYHFQRLFTRWVGTTPKRFLQILTVNQGKQLLDGSSSLLQASEALGLSSSSRLHDHFVQLEAVTPGEYKKKGDGLCIEYGISQTPFGNLFVAVTPRGVCHAAFLSTEELDPQVEALQTRWPRADFSENHQIATSTTQRMLKQKLSVGTPLSIHVKGTNFQIAVWRALLNIPFGQIMHYGQLAKLIGHPRSARAVGNAIAANPVALLIPCHRVIQQSGALGGYRWGIERKRIIQLWEHLSITASET